MSTFGTMIADVKSASRETTTEKDAFLLQVAARLYRQYVRSDDWPQTRASVTLTIVSGTQAYDLPADFDRFATDRVNYLWSGSVVPALSIPIVPRGSVAADRRLTLWEGLNTSAGWTYPAIVAIQSGGANTYRLFVYPIAGSSGDTIGVDYYSVPQRSAITTGTAVSVDQLYETMVAATCAEYARYIQDQNQFAIFAGQARDAHRNARQSLARL